MKDYYKILGLGPNPSDSEVRSAYLHLAMRGHPEKHPNNSEAQIKFLEVTDAYLVLSENRKRAENPPQSLESEFKQEVSVESSEEKLAESLLLFVETLRESWGVGSWLPRSDEGSAAEFRTKLESEGFSFSSASKLTAQMLGFQADRVTLETYRDDVPPKEHDWWLKWLPRE